MADLVKYFDKKPNQYFTQGPSGKGVASTGFFTEWRSWFEEGVGITYIQESLYNPANPTGYHASGSQDILFAQTATITFDSGAYLWAGISNFGNVNIFRYSGSSYTTQAAFSGKYPMMYYNVANDDLAHRYVHCFYLKDGQNKIYVRSNLDNFSGENVFHQDFDQTIKYLNVATRFDDHHSKMMIIGLYENGNAFKLVSECYFPYVTGIFNNFSGYPVGTVEYLNDWVCSPAENFTESLYMTHENFVNYPTGLVDYQFNSGINMSGGYVWL